MKNVQYTSEEGHFHWLDVPCFVSHMEDILLHMWKKANHIHRSATTLKPLTGDMNNIDHVIIMQCSAGKPWVLAFMWMPLDTHRHPSKHWCGPSAPPSSQQHYLMAVAPQQDNVPWHTANTAQEPLGEHSQGPKVSTSKFPRSDSPNQIEHL